MLKTDNAWIKESLGNLQIWLKNVDRKLFYVLLTLVGALGGIIATLIKLALG